MKARLAEWLSRLELELERTKSRCTFLENELNATSERSRQTGYAVDQLRRDGENLNKRTNELERSATFKGK